MDIIRTEPAVFAVGKEYQIMFRVNCPTLAWVTVGGECYFDDSNGILRSAVTTHRICVPADELDRAGVYTLTLRRIIERKPYFTETDEPVSIEYSFRPVKGGTIRVYQIADAHDLVESPVRACKAFERRYGLIDFLILNGDLLDLNDDEDKIDNIYRICADITQGCIPVVFARGNRDTRGKCAELCEHTPSDNGNSFYSFRLGDIWGAVMDCGENKPDSDPACGNTVCCHALRMRETRWLEGLIRDAVSEYAAEGIKHRIIIVHSCFTWNYGPNIEPELYRRWAELLREFVRPNLMICGHFHTLERGYPGDANDRLGHPCEVVVGSKPRFAGDGISEGFTGVGIIFGESGIETHFCGSDEFLPE